ncbi:MAG: tRNA pseudouridine(38-40) synthase TruA [Burkholderiaceae bacterium]
MTRIALGLVYDGSGFHGWQTQPSGCTVQDHLESSLAALAGVPIKTICAGRTDAGVHATGQVVHFDTSVQRPMQAWVRGVNARLPGGVAVQWAKQVPDAFHARFSALARCYEYRLYCAPVRHPLLHQTTHEPRPLCIEAMRQAIYPLLGRHDFSAFRSAQCQAANPVRELLCFDIDEPLAGLIRCRIRGNAFLHHMVRNLMGALVSVGAGKRPPSWLFDVLQSRDRRLAARTYPPEGLTLVQVAYDSGFDLPPAARLPW